MHNAFYLCYFEEKFSHLIFSTSLNLAIILLINVIKNMI